MPILHSRCPRKPRADDSMAMEMQAFLIRGRLLLTDPSSRRSAARARPRWSCWTRDQLTREGGIAVCSGKMKSHLMLGRCRTDPCSDDSRWGTQEFNVEPRKAEETVRWCLKNSFTTLWEGTMVGLTASCRPLKPGLILPNTVSDSGSKKDSMRRFCSLSKFINKPRHQGKPGLIHSATSSFFCQHTDIRALPLL